MWTAQELTAELTRTAVQARRWDQRDKRRTLADVLAEGGDGRALMDELGLPAETSFVVMAAGLGGAEECAAAVRQLPDRSQLGLPFLISTHNVVLVPSDPDRTGATLEGATREAVGVLGPSARLACGTAARSTDVAVAVAEVRQVLRIVARLGRPRGRTASGTSCSNTSSAARRAPPTACSPCSPRSPAIPSCSPR